jgi:GT2 family glycosyltransferase
MILASVVVPFLNSGDGARCATLGKTLDALGSQTIRESLLIVVSLDGGEPLPKELADKADLVIEGEWGGPAVARNRGWRASDTPRFVLFTDSDCVPEPDWAEKLLEPLRNGKFQGAKGVYSTGGDRVIQRLAQVEFEERYRLLERQLREDGSIEMVDTYSAAFTARALRQVEGFDESFPAADHEDIDISYRMRELGMKLGFAPAARVSHTHRSGWVAYFGLKASRGYWRSRILRAFPRRSLRDRYAPRALRLQMALVLLIAPLILLGLLGGWALAPIVGWALVFSASCFPLLMCAIRTDVSVAPLIPAFALWRALALVSGVARGMIGRSGSSVGRKKQS